MISIEMSEKLALVTDLKTKAEKAECESNFELAASLYGDVLRILTKELRIDVLNSKLAPIYLLYGNSLLQNAILNNEIANIKCETSNEEYLESGDDTASDMEIQSEFHESNESSDEFLDDFKLAWEALDTARIIYEKDFDINDYIRFSKLGEIHNLLGDLSMEIENFDTASNEFTSSASYLKKLITESEPSIPLVRNIASILFKLGMSFEYLSRKQDALGSFNDTKKILESIIKSPCSDLVDELKPLISELDEKVSSRLS